MGNFVIKKAPLQPSLSFLLKLLSLLYFFTLLYLLLFSSVHFRHIALCASFFLESASTSSFHHHLSPFHIIPLFFPHTSSHAFKIPSLKCSHKFGNPTSTNLITSSLNRFLILKSFSKLIFLLSVHVFRTTLLIFFLSTGCSG